MKPIHFLTFLLFITTNLSAADYYWVGGSGNWADISHWATTSGGVITYSQVPTADDNVYFDANSFTGPGQVVTINNENIFGSLAFIPDMVVDLSGQVRFRIASGSAVESNWCCALNYRKRAPYAGRMVRTARSISLKKKGFIL